MLLSSIKCIIFNTSCAIFSGILVAVVAQSKQSLNSYASRCVSSVIGHLVVLANWFEIIHSGSRNCVHRSRDHLYVSLSLSLLLVVLSFAIYVQGSPPLSLPLHSCYGDLYILRRETTSFSYLVSSSLGCWARTHFDHNGEISWRNPPTSLPSCSLSLSFSLDVSVSLVRSVVQNSCKKARGARGRERQRAHPLYLCHERTSYVNHVSRILFLPFTLAGICVENKLEENKKKSQEILKAPSNARARFYSSTKLRPTLPYLYTHLFINIHLYFYI